MNYGHIVLVAIAAMIMLPGFVSADWLPNQTPENQVFSIDTVIDATGTVDDKSTMNWIIAS
nr:hypothetical protein [uncultured Methanospirillum sp.]